MERARFITYQGVRILLADLSGIGELAELAREGERISRIIREEPASSLLLLIDLTGTPYNLRLVRTLGEMAHSNSGHVRARAVVGLPQMARLSVLAIGQYTRRPAEAFPDLETAMEWLVRQ